MLSPRSLRRGLNSIAERPFFWISQLLGEGGLLHSGQDGVDWGEQQMIAESDGLTVRLSARTTVYRWAAIRELRKTETLILLLYMPEDAIPIPRRAFAGRAEEKRFCDFVRARMAEAAANP